MDGPLSYGKSLPDQAERLAALSDAQLELLSDIRELYRERVAIEREYATKLQLLSKKAADKKNRKAANLIFGNEPTKAWDENTLQQSTLERAYSQIISSIGETAQDHVNLADGLNQRAVEALKSAERRYEEANKRQTQHYQKLLTDRDKAYGDRLKTKQKYDEECVEVELFRQKQERSGDDRHAERVAKQYEQQQIDMLNSKNVYLISTAIANRAKARFYDEDLPTLEDQYQLLHTQLLSRLGSIIIQAQSLEDAHLDVLKSRVAATCTAFKNINTSKDQALFIDHNIRQFAAPPDWGFEPCPTHYDTGDMSVEPQPKVYLQNRLGKSRQKFQELQPIIKMKRQETEQLDKLVKTYTEKPTLGNVDEVSDSYLDFQHQLTFYAISEDLLSTEIDTIAAVLQGDEGGNSPHAFKSSSFSIPTPCAYCKSSIWGLSKQGKTCKSCGISVHTKCELKIPSDCFGARGGRGHQSSSSISTSYTASSSRESRVSVTPSLATPTPSSFTPSLDSASNRSVQSYPVVRTLFDFTPTSPLELAVTEGIIVQVLEEDDGSGWVKVQDPTGSKGLVPASYVEIVEEASPVVSTPASGSVRGKPGPQGSGKYVRAVYDYRPQEAGELDLTEGGLIELTEGPNGGQNYADGWWEGLDTNGKKGIFPSNYVEPVL